MTEATTQQATNETLSTQSTTKKWWQCKTIWTGILGLAAAGAALATGEMTSGQAVQTGVTSLIGIFLRTGMLK